MVKSMLDSERKRPRRPFSMSQTTLDYLKTLADEFKIPQSRIVEALILSPFARQIVESYVKMHGSEKSTRR